MLALGLTLLMLYNLFYSLFSSEYELPARLFAVLNTALAILSFKLAAANRKPASAIPGALAVLINGPVVALGLIELVLAVFG